MDHRDEFSKWISTVEEALSSEIKTDLSENMSSEECGCGKWDCSTCFPEQDVHPGENAQVEDGTSEIIIVVPDLDQHNECPHCGYSHSDQEGHGEEMEVPMAGQLDELSRNTLASYIPKAANSAADLASKGAYTLGSTPESDPDWSDAGEEDDRKAFHRLKNIKKAASRLATNETGFSDEGSSPWTHDENGQESPLSYGEDNLTLESEDQMEWEECETMINEILNIQDMGFSMSEHPYTREELEVLPPEKIKSCYEQVMGKPVEEEMQDEEMLSQPSAGADQMPMPSAGGGSAGGATYPPGTAPTMPESIQKGKRIMENVDKDVAAMLNSLKKYDILKESVAPVLGIKTVNEKKGKPEWLEDAEKKAEKKDDKKDSGESDSEGGEIDESTEEEKNPWEKLAKGDKEDKKSDVGKSHKTSKGGTVTKTDKGLKHVKESSEVADPDVLEWMNRLSKLGNMKGYGR